MDGIQARMTVHELGRVDTGKEQPWDGWMLVIVCALLGLGLVMIFSASAVTAEWRYGDPLYFLKRQLFFLMIGFALLYIGLRVDYRYYYRAVYPVLGVTIALLALVNVTGHTAGGAQRWLNLGLFRIQPGELTKITMVMVLSYSLAKKGERVKSFMVGLVPHLLVVGVVVLLLMQQPDFGTSVIIITMMFVLLFVAGTRVNYLAMLGAAAVIMAWRLIVMSPYRMKRWEAFMNPWEHRQDSSYQVVESIMAIGSGGLTGEGLGDGLGKLGFVPALETDFIGSAIAQELGFVGISLVIILFLLFIWRGTRIAMGARDAFGTYLAFGLVVLFSLQTAINLGVISGMLPTKGLTLPFISYGGSSLLMSMYAIGILLNISRCSDDEYMRRREEKDERKKRERWEKKRQRILARREEERLT